MTIDEFDRALAIVGGDPDAATIHACKLAITYGLSLHAAARHVGITHPTVYRKMAELRAALAMPVCEACGQINRESTP